MSLNGCFSVVVVFVVCGFVMGCERRVVDGHRFCGKCWGIVIVMSGVVSVVVDG